MPGVIAGFLFVFVVALGTSTEIQLLGGAGDSSIAIMINDVMRVVNFPARLRHRDVGRRC